MENFGEFLRKQRESKNIRLEEIASITKIHLHNLQLLEKGEWSQLPPEPFIRGFIIAYAKYVGLESKDAVRLFLESRQQLTGSNDVGIVNSETFETTGRASQATDVEAIMAIPRWTPLKKVAIGSLALLIAGILAGVSYVGRNSIVPLSTEVLTEKAPESQPADTTEVATIGNDKGLETEAIKSSGSREAASEKAQTAAAAPGVPHEVTVEGRERTWMKVVIDDEKPRETFLKANEVMKLSATSKIKVVLGNSTGTKVTHNGEVISGEKFSGTIRSYIFPKDARFPQDPPKRTTAKELEGNAGDHKPTGDSD